MYFIIYQPVFRGMHELSGDLGAVQVTLLCGAQSGLWYYTVSRSYSRRISRRKYNLQLRAAIPRLSILLAYYWRCCVGNHWQCPVMQEGCYNRTSRMAPVAKNEHPRELRCEESTIEPSTVKTKFSVGAKIKSLFCLEIVQDPIRSPLWCSPTLLESSPHPGAHLLIQVFTHCSPECPRTARPAHLRTSLYRYFALRRAIH